MNAKRAGYTLTLTSIYLAAGTSWSCGSSASADCAQTATCGVGVTPEAGNGDNSNTVADAATVVADGGHNLSDGGTGFAESGACQTDDDCSLGTICSAHSCVPGCSDNHGCQAPEACCTGKCFNTKTDVQHCGGCSACTVANASAACTDGACTVAMCSQGFVDCDGKADNGCELAKPAGPNAPSPTRPVNGDYTGSFRADAAAKTLRPTFKWTTSSPDTCGAVSYQIQLDDSCQPGSIPQCAFPSPEVDTSVMTTSFTPATALTVHETQPVGTRYYWRVRACDAAKVCSSWSSVRYVDVGRLRDDVNGDGYSDILVGGGASDLYLYLGGKPPSEQPAAHGTPGTSFAFAGDVNGDGYADFIIGDPSANSGAGSKGAVRVYYGRSTWTSELGSESFVVNAPVDGTAGFATDIAAAGDFNGDGYADIMATHPSDVKVSLFYGANVTTAVASLTGLSFAGHDKILPDAFGRVGDLDGDGYSEIGVLSRMAGGSSVMEFFRGGPAPSNTVFQSKAFASTLYRMRPAGDLDGDGFDDVVFSALGVPIPYSTFVSLRGQADFAINGGLVATRTFEDDDAWHDGLAAGLDANGDGLPDVYWTTGAGYAVALIPGATGFSDQSPSSSVPQPNGSGSSWGSALAMGDYDGDGIADLVVASTLWSADVPTVDGLVTVALHAGGMPRHLTAPSTVGLGAVLGH